MTKNSTLLIDAVVLAVFGVSIMLAMWAAMYAIEMVFGAYANVIRLALGRVL